MDRRLAFQRAAGQVVDPAIALGLTALAATPNPTIRDLWMTCDQWRARNRADRLTAIRSWFVYTKSIPEAALNTTHRATDAFNAIEAACLREGIAGVDAARVASLQQQLADAQSQNEALRDQLMNTQGQLSNAQQSAAPALTLKIQELQTKLDAKSGITPAMMITAALGLAIGYAAAKRLR